MKIQIVVWNTNGLALCETISETVKQVNRNNFFKRLIRKNCVITDFFSEIEEIIIKNEVDLFVVLTIDAKSGSKFHSDLLPDYLNKLDFIQVFRMKDNRVTGDSDFRISTYMSSKYYNSTTTITDGDENCKSLTGVIDRVGGVMGFRLVVGALKLGFIGAYLPESQKNLLSLERGDEDINVYRRVVVSSNNICLKGAMNRLWGNLDKLDKPKYIFVFGDLNYQVNIPSEVPNLYIKKTQDYSYSVVRKYDELTYEIEKGIFPNYKEGVDNRGPAYNPDYPLEINRDLECQKLGTCYALKGIFPSWTQRIIYYQDLRNTRKDLKCLKYTSMDIGNISQSNHTLIYGIYEI